VEGTILTAYHDAHIEAHHDIEHHDHIDPEPMGIDDSQDYRKTPTGSGSDALPLSDALKSDAAFVYKEAIR